jgi:hypothetical protein
MTQTDLILKMLFCTEIAPPLSVVEIYDFILCKVEDNGVHDLYKKTLLIEDCDKEWLKTDYITKKRIKEEIQKTNKEINEWMELKRKKKSYCAPYEIEKCLEKKKKLTARLGYIGKIKPSDDKANAKLVPISNFIEIVSGFATTCPFHKTAGEKSSTPSLKYYPSDNHVYCFVCTKRGDCIDVVMAKNSIDFNSAVKTILGK